MDAFSSSPHPDPNPNGNPDDEAICDRLTAVNAARYDQRMSETLIFAEDPAPSPGSRSNGRPSLRNEWPPPAL